MSDGAVWGSDTPIGRFGVGKQVRPPVWRWPRIVFHHRKHYGVGITVGWRMTAYTLVWLP